MKYLKTFENINELEIGDYAKCVKDNFFQDRITKNNLYKVLNKMLSTNGKIIYIHQDNNNNYWWSLDRFVKATPEEIEQHKIKKDTDKYNI